MKKLFLIRHAKSDWNNSSQILDIDRPLNTRGVKNSYEMAERLKFKKIQPQQIISSNGIRALHTAIIFAKTLDVEAQNIVVKENLYHASQSTLLKTIQSIDNEIDNAFIFAHNPGINDFAYSYIPNFYNNIPTCAILAFQLSSENWSDWNEKNVELDFFDYPKKSDA